MNIRDFYFYFKRSHYFLNVAVNESNSFWKYPWTGFYLFRGVRDTHDNWDKDSS